MFVGERAKKDGRSSRPRDVGDVALLQFDERYNETMNIYRPNVWVGRKNNCCSCNRQADVTNVELFQQRSPINTRWRTRFAVREVNARSSMIGQNFSNSKWWTQNGDWGHNFYFILFSKIEKSSLAKPKHLKISRAFKHWCISLIDILSL